MLPVYVINLESSQERWLRSSTRLDELGIKSKRFDAVNGMGLQPSELESYVDRHADRRWRYDLLPPEVGCYLSHVRLWDLIAHDEHPGAFVLEDDFDAADDLPSVMEAISRQEFSPIPTMIKLYGPSNRSDKRLPFNVPLTGQYKLTIPYHIPYGLVAYYINKVGARAVSRSRRRFYRPVDEDMRRDWETGVTTLLVSPYPVKHSDAPSTIDPLRRQSVRQQSGRYKRLIWYGSMSALYLPVRILRAHRVLATFAR